MRKLLVIAAISTLAVAANAKHKKVDCTDAKNAAKKECTKKAEAATPATAKAPAAPAATGTAPAADATKKQ